MPELHFIYTPSTHLEATPWVILHGLLGSARNWGTTAKKLAQFRPTWALDLRNHGSSFHAEEMNFHLMAQDVLKFLNTHGLDRVHLMGHSMGGKVAMKLACAHPERIQSLTVVDIAPKSYEEVHYTYEFQAMQHLPLTPSLTRQEADAALASWISDPLHRQFLLTNLVRREDHLVWQVNLSALGKALSDLATNPLHDFDRYNGPTHFICGGDSHFVVEQDLPIIRKHFPDTECSFLENVGHNPHVEAQDAFVTLAEKHVTGY
jgi:esterase